MVLDPLSTASAAAAIDIVVAAAAASGEWRGRTAEGDAGAVALDIAACSPFAAAFVLVELVQFVLEE